MAELPDDVTEPLPERVPLPVALLLAVTDCVVDADGAVEMLELRDGVTMRLSVGATVVLPDVVTEPLPVREPLAVALLLAVPDCVVDAGGAVVVLILREGVTIELDVGDADALPDVVTEPVSDRVPLPVELPLAVPDWEPDDDAAVVALVLCESVTDELNDDETVTLPTAVKEPLQEREPLAVALLLAVPDCVADADDGNDALEVADSDVDGEKDVDTDKLGVTVILAMGVAADVSLRLVDAKTLMDAVTLDVNDGELDTVSVGKAVVVGSREELADSERLFTTEDVPLPLPDMLAEKVAAVVPDDVIDAVSDTLLLSLKLGSGDVLREIDAEKLGVKVAATLLLLLLLVEADNDVVVDGVNETAVEALPLELRLAVDEVLTERDADGLIVAEMATLLLPMLLVASG